MKIDEFNNDYLFAVLRYGGIENLAEELEESVLPSEEDHETVAGFVFDLFGRFPAQGDTVSFRRLAFTVNKVSGKRITEVRIQRLKKEVADVA
jgi:CBS domain containing-hemolysin-like protein